MAKSEMKAVRGYSDYLVSKSGKLFSKKSGTIVEVKGSVCQGYAHAKLSKGSTVKNVLIHRLVAAAFLKKPTGKDIVNHIDGDKLNNKVSNLEWTNHRGNMKHYSKELAPTYKVKRQKAKKDSLDAKLSVIQFAFDTFKDDPESFAKVYAATLGNN